MRHFLTPFIVLAFLATPLAADPNEDAKYIVSQTVSEELFAGAINVMTPLIANSLIVQLQKKNVVVSDPEALIKIVGEEFLEEFTLGVQKELIPYYLENFSTQQLSDLAAFYKTDTGQFFIKQTPELMQFGKDTGERVGGPAVANIMPRVDKRLKDEGITITKD